jgi:hypothetical protein
MRVIKKILIGILAIFVLTVLLLVSLYWFYFSSDNEDVIVEVRDSKGRIIEKRLKDYDCCEGFLEKTTRFDTLGNKLSEIGTLDNSRFRIDFSYDKGNNLVKEMRYEWLEDNNVNDSLVSIEKTFAYTMPDSIRNTRIVCYYLDDWDTLSIEEFAINRKGDTISWALQMNNRIDYDWGDSTLTSYKVLRTYSNKIDKTIDTLEVVEVVPKRYHRSDI